MMKKEEYLQIVQQIIDRQPTGLLVTDPNLQICAQNRQAKRLRPAFMIGEQMDKLFLFSDIEALTLLSSLPTDAPLCVKVNSNPYHIPFWTVTSFKVDDTVFLQWEEPNPVPRIAAVVSRLNRNLDQKRRNALDAAECLSDSEKRKKAEYQAFYAECQKNKNNTNLYHFISLYYQTQSPTLQLLDLGQQLSQWGEQIKQRFPLIADKLILDCFETSLFVRLDSVQFAKDFSEICLNALQAVSELSDGMVKVRCYREENCAVVSVEDNGAGIRQEHQISIFEPLFTTGTDSLGLGLTITKLSVEQQHGVVTAENKEDGGARLLVSFPLENFQGTLSETRSLYDETYHRADAKMLDILAEIGGYQTELIERKYRK